MIRSYTVLSNLIMLKKKKDLAPRLELCPATVKSQLEVRVVYPGVALMRRQDGHLSRSREKSGRE